MADLDEIMKQLRQMAADNEAYRQEQARQREIDKRELAKQRVLDRQYLDQRLHSMETSFSQKLSDVSTALDACSTISSQSSKRSRDSFEKAILCDPEEDVRSNWFADQPLWAGNVDAEVVSEQPESAAGGHAAWSSDPPQPGSLQHSQLLTPATVMGVSAVLKVLPSDNPKQCLLCGKVFSHKRYCIECPLTSFFPLTSLQPLQIAYAEMLECHVPM